MVDAACMTTDETRDGTRPAAHGEATPTHCVDAQHCSFRMRLTGSSGSKEERSCSVAAATMGAMRIDDKTRARRDAPPTEKGSRGACGEDRGSLEQLAAELRGKGHRDAKRDPFPATGTGAPPNTTHSPGPPSASATHAQQRRWQWKEALRQAGPVTSPQDV